MLSFVNRQLSFRDGTLVRECNAPLLVTTDAFGVRDQVKVPATSDVNRRMTRVGRVTSD
jgi:hypothetical protein